MNERKYVAVSVKHSAYKWRCGCVYRGIERRTMKSGVLRVIRCTRISQSFIL